MCIQESVQTDHDAAPYKNQIYQNLCHNHSLFQKWHAERKEKNNYPDMKQLEVSACMLV